MLATPQFKQLTFLATSDLVTSDLAKPDLATSKHNSLPSMPFGKRERRQTHVSDLVLGDLSFEQTELLLGALGFLASSQQTWISWVNPPHTAQLWLRERAPSAMQIRLLYQDAQHSAFHLLYKTLQAGNNAWVVGNAIEISTREREILEQAAEHHGCRLLLVSQRRQHH